MIDSALCRRYCEVLDDEQNEHESMLCMEQQREGEGKRARECARERERRSARCGREIHGKIHGQRQHASGSAPARSGSNVSERCIVHKSMC